MVAFERAGGSPVVGTSRVHSGGPAMSKAHKSAGAPLPLNIIMRSRTGSYATAAPLRRLGERGVTIRRQIGGVVFKANSHNSSVGPLPPNISTRLRIGS